MKHIYLSLVGVLVLLTLVVSGHSIQAHARYNNIPCYAIANSPLSLSGGTFTLAVNIPGFPDPGNVTFNVCGTLHGMHSLDIGTPTPFFPEGQYITGWTGNWRQIGEHKFQWFQTNVLTKKDLTVGKNYPNIPIARIVVKGTIILSQDGMSITSTDSTFQFYDINDTHLVNPPTDPALFGGDRFRFRSQERG